MLKERRAAVRGSALGHHRGPGRLLLLLLTLGGVPAAVPVAAQTIASAANQTFVVGNTPTTMSAITITDAKPPTITAANDIRIRIPASFNMTWNTALTTATLGGGAAAKVSTTVTYEDAGKTLVLNVTTNFAGNDKLTVSGLQFMNFTATSTAGNLELVVSGAGGSTADLDSRTITIVTPTISSAANQTFIVGQAATAMSAITITDATPATITAAKDIRIRIPASLNMSWNTSITTATITWLSGGGSKVSTTVSYEDAGKTLVLNATANFANGNRFSVSGLQFSNFTAASAADHLQLVVSGSGGGTAATDDKTITILGYGVSVSPHTTAASQLPSNGTSYTVGFTVQNTGGVTDSYDLLTKKRPGTVITTVSITGSGVTQGANPDSARLTSLAPAASAAVTVTYRVGNVAAGSKDTLILTARSVASPTQKDSGQLQLAVVRPSMTITKAVIPAGTSPPGTDLAYTVTITNAGTSSATSVVVVDTLPSTVRFKLGSVVNSLPAGVSVLVDYSNNGGATWTYVPASGGCGAPGGYDGCVNRVRWRLQNPLSSVAPNNTGTLQLVTQIR